MPRETIPYDVFLKDRIRDLCAEWGNEGFVPALAERSGIDAALINSFGAGEAQITDAQYESLWTVMDDHGFLIRLRRERRKSL